MARVFGVCPPNGPCLQDSVSAVALAGPEPNDPVEGVGYPAPPPRSPRARVRARGSGGRSG
jgi:hypothetical protein